MAHPDPSRAARPLASSDPSFGADYRVLTPERVSLRYEIAGIGSRGAALLVDSLVQLALAVVLVAGAMALLVVLGVMQGIAEALADIPDSGGSVVGFLILGVVVVGLFAIFAGYFIAFEIVWNGQTPGKRMLGLRVIRENGYPMRPVDAVIRNLVRIVDSLPTAYAVGLLTMLLNSRSRRLGDFAAGTVVVHEGARAGALLPVAETQGHGRLLSPDDATLVRDFLLRRTALDASSRSALASRLAQIIARRYALELDDDPEVFLEQMGT
jgi:uncharacterized RDD family membrane protein YckC